VGLRDETLEQTGSRPHEQGATTPGVVLILEAGTPVRRAFAIPHLGLEFGRGVPQGALEGDDRVSRRHVKVAHASGVWAVNDLASRNGTFVNGEPIEGYVELTAPPLIRLGNSLIWSVPDIAPYSIERPVDASAAGAPVVGALLGKVWDAVAAASRAGDTLLIRGESGAGKELAARHLHQACFGQSAAPFIAVNCAAIPEGLSERLLFGAKRGAYSGAASDAQGYVTAADKGTLFLDEVAELDPLVQAKLLRVLETREVLPLGESRPHPVNIRVVAASHKNLREEVSAGRFRQDLYFRIGRPEVVLPPLRERLDELPSLIQGELLRSRPDRTASVAFIEACALRPWPGNVRELLREVRLAAHAPSDAGSKVLGAEQLAPEAGQLIVSSAVSAQTPAVAPTEQTVEAAMKEHKGNVTRAAKALGLHRNQLRRWLAKHTKGAPNDSGDD
jgi:transcriptional regulator of acetoin/glycerol metabolism